MYEPRNLGRWSAEGYIGKQYDAFFVVLGQHRDSTAIERSNFEQALAALGGESRTVAVARSNHWAVGWCEQLMVHESDDKALELADELLDRLSGYPVLDEVDVLEKEREEAQDAWDFMDTEERMRACCKGGASVFAARRKQVPGDLVDLLRAE